MTEDSDRLIDHVVEVLTQLKIRIEQALATADSK